MEKHNDNNNTSKQVLLSVLGVAILIVAVVGISFAVFSYSKQGEVVNTISTGSITMSYDWDTAATNGIKIENAIPMSNDQGKVITAGSNNTFDFTVNANLVGKTQIDYEIVARKDLSKETNGTDADLTQSTTGGGTTTRGTAIDDADIRLYLEESTDGTTYTESFAPAAYTGSAARDTYGAPAGVMVLKQGTFNSTSEATGALERTDYYRLRMWVGDTYVMDGVSRKYTVKIDVYGRGHGEDYSTVSP